MKKLWKGSCEASKSSLQTHAGRHLSNPRLYKATMYMRDSEGTCFVDSAPMAICMSGKGSWKGSTRVTTPDSETTRVMMSIVKKISMRSLFAIFLMF